MHVWFYEAFEEEVEALRRYLPQQIEAGFTWKTIQESGDLLPPARLISIRTQSAIPSDWYGRLDGLLARTTGWDHLVGLPLRCGYLPLYCNRAVAEQAMLLWMALLRRLPQQIAQFPRFHRDGLTGLECAGKNLLVVGAGHVGSEVVKIGRGLEMNVRRVDIIPERADVSIDDGMPWADIIVCSMNLTPLNRGYFNYARLKQARRGVIFVNVARGEMSPTADLVRLLDEGHLGGVGLDVYEDEGKLATELRSGKGGFPLLGRPNVILTPHNAFNTQEAVERKAQQSIQQICAFLEGGRFIWEPPSPLTYAV
ncbi:MAG: hydroxyacid dehydrogenase [Verrucomicrobiae bacterium]|nr:hydroxyacid dehydrogenase [Verrucomicrobiae bacterium]